MWRSWLARSVRDAEAAGSSPATPTNQDILKIEGHLVARSPRLRRGYARIFPYISAQNQTAFENQKSVFYPTGVSKDRQTI